MTRIHTLVLLHTLLLGGVAFPAAAQPAAQTDAPIEGTVTSVTRSTIVVRTKDEYRVFELTSNTTRPATIPVGATVRVTPGPASPGRAPQALQVSVTAAPPAPQEGQPAAAPGGAADEPVPPAVRRLEEDILRQTRRYRAGVRAGVGLDPELVMLGAQIQLGPFFNEKVMARPNLELGFGEVTDLVAFNFEGVYQLPVTSPQNRWTVFIGGGPALNFRKLGFSAEGDDTEEDDFSFDDFEFEAGFNIVAGIQSRSGLFLEVKGTAYSSPNLRFIIGYNF